MDTSSSPPSTPAGRRRRRPLAAAAVVLAFALGAGLALSPTSAGADIKRCEDGSRPPCPEPPEPEPTPPPPPLPLWSANVTIADLSGGLGFSRSVASYWFRAGSPRHITGGSLMTWADAAQTRGTALMADPQSGLPAGNVRGFYLVEWGSRGPLCRSQPYTQVPASGRNAEVILAPRSVTTPAALDTVAAGLVGPMDGIPDTDLQVATAEIDVVDAHLQVTLRGHLSVDLQFPIPNLDASFTYVTDILMSESQSTDNVNELIAMSATPGVLEITGDGVTDDIELMLAPNLKPRFQNATQTQARAAVVGLVEANPLVAQFRAQGYVLSARKLVVNPTVGIEVWPSLCRFT